MANDGEVVVKLDGKKLEEIGEAMRAATSDAAVELVKAGASVEASPPKPTAKPAGEPGVRRTKKYLPCVLTEAELHELHRELARAIADADDAAREVEHLKESMKVKVAGATQHEKELRASLADKARTAREGKLHRDVDVTVRIDWHARRKITTRDDTGEVLSEEAATALEVADCGTWEKDIVAGKSYLRAPDGAVLDERALTDAERQTTLPLADGGKALEGEAVPLRAWCLMSAWDDLSAEVQGRLEKPDPHGKAPPIEWIENGAWMSAIVPAGLRPVLDHHAVQAELSLIYSDSEPTLADLAATSKEPAGKPRKGTSKKRVA